MASNSCHTVSESASSSPNVKIEFHVSDAEDAFDTWDASNACAGQ